MAHCNAIFIFVDLLLIPFLELKPLDVALAVVGGQSLWTRGEGVGILVAGKVV